MLAAALLLAAAPPPPDPAPLPPPSAVARRVEAWVTRAGDSHGLPFAIIDKAAGALFLYRADGTPLAAVPVLTGIAPGDTASPGVGSKRLGDLGPAEKTTPAGRFLAKFGLPLGGERVLWVDYATSVAIHPIPADADPREERRRRMLSPQADDNRITFGCINVPRAFYRTTLAPLFRGKGGYVYILPEATPIEAVFPRLRAEPVIGA